jgi:hypothetical protein
VVPAPKTPVQEQPNTQVTSEAPVIPPGRQSFKNGGVLPSDSGLASADVGGEAPA